MKTLRYVPVGCAFAFLLAIANLAQADTTLINYDFASLADGGLIGQDSWMVNEGWPDLTVTNGVGAANSNAVASGAIRSVTLPTFSSTDTLVATARFYSIGTSDTTASIAQGAWLPGFGTSNAKAYFRDLITGEYNEYYGDDLTQGNTYEFKETIDLSVAGGLASIAYRDITTGGEGAAFTADSALQNIPMGLAADGSGNYHLSSMAMRIINFGTGISQFTLSTVSVPEPCSWALLSSALIGLLAYAWRKRR